MRRISQLIITVVMGVALAACNSTDNSPSREDASSVTAADSGSVHPPADGPAKIIDSAKIDSGKKDGALQPLQLTKKSAILGKSSCGKDALLKLALFTLYLTGDFNNQKQYDQEVAAGNAVHPFAEHVNRIINDRIDNLPADVFGVFMLEEGYYTYPGKDKVISPFLFKFDLNAKCEVQLTSYSIPTNLAPKDFTNANSTWRLDFAALKVSPTFPPSPYTYDPATMKFDIDVTFTYPSGTTFRLDETISFGRLEVLELPMKNGKPMLPYSTPIMYELTYLPLGMEQSS